MEFVDGQTLADLVRKNQRLEVREAVGYILQAARGLKCAHDQSMIHRDMKPENLFVDRHGLVKVADLGLTLTPAAALAEEAASGGKPIVPVGPGASAVPASGPIAAIGTPGYTAPELAMDPARADVRTDIYSLGCTLHASVTGRPPYEGRTLLEILGKQQTQPVTAPDLAAQGIPRDLAAIILKMVATKPEERYIDLSDVIENLEAFLGIQATGPFIPQVEHAELLGTERQGVERVSAARTKAKTLLAILAACFAMAILCMMPGWWLASSAFLSLGLFIALADFVFVGVRRKTPLFMKVCALVLGSSRSEWLTILSGVALFVGLLVDLEALLDLGCPGPGSRWYRVGTANRARRACRSRARRAPLENVEQMLKSLRLQGQDEEALRQFVCKYSGPHWESFYEALFGYEAKLAARQRCSGATVQKPGPDLRLARPDRALDRCQARRASPGEGACGPCRRSRKEPRKPGRKPGNGPTQSRAIRAGHGRDGCRDQGNDPRPRGHDHGEPLDHRAPCARPPSSPSRFWSNTSQA